MTISAIAVIGSNRELGCGNQLLWKLSPDMERFKKLTTDHVVVMGKKTFESIGGALPNRTNIIITRDQNFRASGCLFANTVEQALELAKENEEKANGKNGEVFIIGGGSIYEQLLSKIDKLYLTVVADSPPADTFFPDYSEFKKILFQEDHEHQGIKFTFLELTR